MTRTFNGQDWFKLRQDVVKKNYNNDDQLYTDLKDLLGKLGDKYTRKFIVVVVVVVVIIIIIIIIIIYLYIIYYNNCNHYFFADSLFIITFHTIIIKTLNIPATTPNNNPLK